MILKERNGPLSAICFHILVCFLMLVCLITVFASSAVAKPQLFTRSQILMGTSFEMTIEAEPAAAEQGFGAFFGEVRRLDKILSHYDPQSELSSLMQSSGQGAVKVSKDLFEVLQEAEGISRLSQGAFDITVGVWTPPDGVFDESGPRDPRVGWQLVELLPGNRVQLKVHNMRLDLGGLAKGYALDRGKKILLEIGLNRFLLSSGGSTFVAGLPPRGETAWPVLIPSLEKGRLGRQVNLSQDALSVSECRPNPEGSVIIDPVKQILLKGPGLAAVKASRGVLADALSTALLVTPKGMKRKMVRVQGVQAAWIVSLEEETLLGRKPEKIFRPARY